MCLPVFSQVLETFRACGHARSHHAVATDWPQFVNLALPLYLPLARLLCGLSIQSEARGEGLYF